MGKLVVIHKNLKCNFCGISENDFLKYGPMYKIGKIRAHYYCVLLSNRLIQNGDDNEGLLGFLIADMQAELKRTLKIFCVYCKKGNATIQCATKRCNKSFHLPCGIKGGTLHQFADQFKSFCPTHRPPQNVPKKVLKEAIQSNVICCICYEEVDMKCRIDTLWAPCCVKTWYHRLCVQKLALSAGYFFRCAACNDTEKFNKWMQKFGIFVPQHDASWELVPNAFEELLFRHNKCDAEKCKCPNGRQKNVDNTIWEIVLCGTCGSQGIHIGCGGLKFLDPEWECPNCQKVTQNMKTMSDTVDDNNKDVESSSNSLKLTKICQRKRRRDSEDLINSILDKRKKCRTLSEENKAEDVDEVEIDVETVGEELKNTIDEDVPGSVKEDEDILSIEVVKVQTKNKTVAEDALSGLKPGPKSYKLSFSGKTCQTSSPKKTIQHSDSIEVIELSDSDGEKGDGDDDDDDDDDDDVRLIKDNSERESEDDFELIRPELEVNATEVDKGGEKEKEEEEEEKEKEGEKEDKENDVHIELTDKNKIEDVPVLFSFSFSLQSNKWEIGDNSSTYDKNTSSAGFSVTINPPTVPSPPAESETTSDSCSKDKDTTQDCKSDFREEKDLETDSDYDVIILTD